MNSQPKPTMAPAEKIVKEYVKCPHCGESTGIDFIGDYEGVSNTWEHRHKECGGFFMYGYVDGQAVVGPIEGAPNQTLIMSLMVIPPQKHPVYFIIGNSTYSRNNDGTPNLDRDYYYNQHSCPTNWLDDIQAVIIEDDADPHGLIQHVRSIPTNEYQRIRDEVRAARGYGPDATDGGSDGTTDFVCAATTFPELMLPLDNDEVIEMEVEKITPEQRKAVARAIIANLPPQPDPKLIGRGLLPSDVYPRGLAIKNEAKKEGE